MSVVIRLKELLRRTIAPPSAAPAVAVDTRPSERWQDQLAALGVSTPAWLQERRRSGRLYADLRDASIETVRVHWPDRLARLIAAADRVMTHEFDLLGSGPLVISDPRRPIAPEGYRPIDWAVDPILGLRFPEGFPHKQWNPQMRPGLADIKWPWEIGRCQHWVTLGQAFRLTGDERYAEEIVRQHADFMHANPIGIGVQFVCTMDVAIRALNWVLAFELIRTSTSFDDAAMARAYESLFDLGAFIEGNLENKYEVTSNHFLSNVVGLYAVGAVFADLPAGQRWLRQCREWLEQEMQVQVLEDGADYESSVPYHRLVAELFLGGARIAQLQGTPLSAGYLASLRRMVDFHFGVLRPDGLMPQIGDADDGRLQIFTDYGTWKPQDGRHLAGAAAAVFNDASWLSLGGEDAAWEAQWWGCDFPPGAAFVLPDHARLYEQAGLAVSRDGGGYLLIANGRVGTNGFGNHKHNDLLSFEYHDGGVPLIVDPGSYVYTSNPDARNLFRGTRYHSTLTVDGVEQNDVRPDYLFRMFETSTTEHRDFVDHADQCRYVGAHTGYERLPSPVTHQRSFSRSKRPAMLTVVDRLSGSGEHQLLWHFHLAPGITVTKADAGAIVLTNGSRQWMLTYPASLRPAVSDAWYSPSYGVRLKCQAIDLALTATLAGDYEVAFEIRPVQRG